VGVFFWWFGGSYRVGGLFLGAGAQGPKQRPVGSSGFCICFSGGVKLCAGGFFTPCGGTKIRTGKVLGSGVG